MFYICDLCTGAVHTLKQVKSPLPAIFPLHSISKHSYIICTPYWVCLVFQFLQLPPGILIDNQRCVQIKPCSNPSWHLCSYLWFWKLTLYLPGVNPKSSKWICCFGVDSIITCSFRRGKSSVKKCCQFNFKIWGDGSGGVLQKRSNEISFPKQDLRLGIKKYTSSLFLLGPLWWV